MEKEIYINLDTILNLISEILENQDIYLIYNNEDNIVTRNNYSVFVKNILSILRSDKRSKYENKNLYNKELKKLSVLLRNLSAKFNTIRNVIDYYTLKNNEGLSIVDMCEIAFELPANDDISKELHEKLIATNSYQLSDYSWIVGDLNKITKTTKLNDYIKYKRFNDSSKFKYFIDDISCEEITKIQYKLDCLLNNKYALAPPIYINAFTSIFINAKLSLDIDDNTLLEYVKNLDIDKSINDIKDLKWYHYLSPKTYKKITSYNNEIIKKKKEKYTDIFNQCKENIESINLYIDSLKFMKTIIKPELFDLIYKCIYDENEMYTFLNNISKDLLLYKEYLIIKQSINSLPIKDRELLDFCYDKSYTISENRRVLSRFPEALILYCVKQKEQDMIDISLKRDILDKSLEELNSTLILIVNIFKSINLLKSPYNFELLNDIDTDFKEDENSIIYYLSGEEDDDCITFINNFMESFKLDTMNKSLTNKDNNKLIKLIINTIEDLGYKVIENFKFNNITLELVALKENTFDKFVYLCIDSMFYDSTSTIIKLNYLKSNEIPIIYCWSELFLDNKSIEIMRLKLKLEEVL